MKKAFRDIESHISTSPFFVFYKGSKAEPKCKFSKKLKALLDKAGYSYSTYDILQDERIRQWIKVYSKWPTFPQIFLDQKFVGGIDVVSELVENDEFDEMVPQSCKPLPPKQHAGKICSENKVVILINGTASDPKDEASKNMVDKFGELNVPFMFLDVQSEPEYLTAFEGISVPFVIVDGKPACGLDGIEQLGLASPSRDNKTVVQRIEDLLKSNDVMLFMKGVPEAPECGFSRKIIQVLKQYDGLQYGHFNIFTDNEIREGLKKYSNWPTYP